MQRNKKLHFTSDVNYWLVGSYWKNEEPQERLPEFKKDGVWINGHGVDKFIERVNAVSKGDILICKSTFRKNGKSVLRFKGVGIVTKKTEFGSVLGVDWQKEFITKDLDDLGFYHDTIHRVRDGDLDFFIGVLNEYNEPSDTDESNQTRNSPDQIEHFKNQADKYRELILAVLENDYLQKIVNSKDNYFELAFQKYHEFKNFPISSKGSSIIEIGGIKKEHSFYEAAFERIKAFYDKPKNERGNYGAFLKEIRNSPGSELFLLIGELISYIDRNAYNIQVWNKYEDKRAIARSTVNQNYWVTNLLRYKQNDFDLRKISSRNIKNAIFFLELTGFTVSILSEKHKEMISENLFQTKYINRQFRFYIESFFQNFDIKIKNSNNKFILYSFLLYNKSIRKIWDDKNLNSQPEDTIDEEVEDISDIVEDGDHELGDIYGHEAEILADNIATQDELGRKGLMQVLFKKIDRLWTKLEDNQSFTVLINGEWGSGKSSMLFYLGEILKTPKNGWTVVNYNAWENQHFDEPWWILVNKVSKEVPGERFGSLTNDFSRSHRLWRLQLGNSPKYIVAFMVSILLIFGFNENLFGNPDKITFYASLLALFGSLWVSIKGVVSEVFKKKSFSVTEEKNAYDPYLRIKKRFIEVIKDKRVAIFIDDLDRCEVDATVKLLEGIQTLFKNSRILYVIAADGTWVSNCFDKKYKDFKCLAKEGQTIGNEFLQKSFQLIVDVPKLSKPQQDTLLKKYLNQEEKEKHKAEEEVSIEELRQKTSIEEISGSTVQKGMKSQIDASTVIEELIEKKKLSYIQKLQAWVPLNMRQIKRLINLFTLKAQVLTFAESLLEVGEEDLLKYILFATEYPKYDQEIRKRVDEEKLLFEIYPGLHFLEGSNLTVKKVKEHL